MKLDLCAFCGDTTGLQRTPVHPALGPTTLCEDCRRLLHEHQQQAVAHGHGHGSSGVGRRPGRPPADPQADLPVLQPILDHLNQHLEELGARGAPCPTFPALTEHLDASGLTTAHGVPWSSENLWQRLKRVGFDRQKAHERGYARFLFQKHHGEEPPPSPSSEEAPANGASPFHEAPLHGEVNTWDADGVDHAAAFEPPPLALTPPTPPTAPAAAPQPPASAPATGRPAVPRRVAPSPRS